MLGMRYIKSDPNTYIMQFRNGKLKQAGKGWAVNKRLLVTRLFP